MKTCPHCETSYHDSQTSCPTHGVLLNEIRDLKPGMVIHKTYRIVRKIGQGGMGTVYLAEHIHMGEQRALKFLSPELSRDKALTSRFLREVRTLRQVHNRNVVDCGDLEAAEDDSLFFSMEFVDGPDLRDFLDGYHPEPHDNCHPERSAAESKDLHLHFGALPVPLGLSIARGIAQGLGAAHAMGMVHRDIKPENILMAREGDTWVPKIADFGIVATKESSSVYTRTGGTLLTMAYAAPEQWRGTAAAELDGRTDLYALGGVLFEMLTGQTVFNAENYEGWAYQHQVVTPRPPSSIRPELVQWPGLDALVLRLLAKDREKRPNGVPEFLSLLSSVTYAPPQMLPIVQSENSRSSSGAPKRRRTPLWARVVSALLVLIAISAAGWRLVSMAGCAHQNSDPFNSLGLPEHDNDPPAMNAEIPTTASISIVNPRGDVTVNAGDGYNIQVQGREIAYAFTDSEAKSIFDSEMPHLTVNGNSVTVKSDGNNSGRLNLIVTVPKKEHVTVDAMRGDVSATGLGAGMYINAPHGNVHLNSIAGSVQVHLANDKFDFSAHQIQGDLNVDGHCSDLTFSEIKGKIVLNGEVFGEVRMENVTGPISLHTSVTDLQVASLPGDLALNPADLRVTEAKGQVRVTTHSKDVDLTQIYGESYVEDRDGRISVEPAGAYGVEAKNSKGDVEVTLPPGASASVNARTRNGNIVSDYPLPNVGNGENKVATFSVGSGGARVVLSAENGDIRIKKH